MKAFHTIAIPHKDILEGRLTLDVFAADLWEVTQKRGPEEYKDSETFFRKTYLTEGLKNLLEIVKKKTGR
jgi:predicted AAA+ superfamily ATPase